MSDHSPTVTNPAQSPKTSGAPSTAAHWRPWRNTPNRYDNMLYWFADLREAESDLESCRERNLPDEASISTAKYTVIRRGALLVALVALARFAVNLDFTRTMGMVVRKYAFLAGSSFKAPLQQRRYVGRNTHAFLCGPTCGRISDVAFDFDRAKLLIANLPFWNIAPDRDSCAPRRLSFYRPVGA